MCAVRMDRQKGEKGAREFVVVVVVVVVVVGVFALEDL